MTRWWDAVDDDRLALERARYLRRITAWDDDPRPIALALAYRQLGYSHSGIAGKLDVSEATVSQYLDQVVAEYGWRAVESQLPADLDAWPDAPIRGDRGGE